MKDMELTLTKASWHKITGEWGACSNEADAVLQVPEPTIVKANEDSQ